MAALNKVLVMGNLGRDPEVRQAGDSTVADFSVAVSEKFKDKSGNQQERTEWVNVVCWGRLSEIARDYLHKGSKVFVEGKLRTRSWSDKNTGQKRYATEVEASNIQMLGGRQESSAPDEQEARRRRVNDYYSQAPEPAPSYDSASSYDDLPF